ncbi:MAG: hypothetical protein COB41_00235 [Proteobacteria bacterium]|nr:MAG: hypothetical protein COB41_00235 [Pseudomonadota bacterium]
MCVMELQVYQGSGVKYVSAEIPCKVERVGLQEVPDEVDFPVLLVNCTESFDTKLSFKLTDSAGNRPVRNIIGNRTCF